LDRIAKAAFQIGSFRLSGDRFGVRSVRPLPRIALMAMRVFAMRVLK